MIRSEVSPLSVTATDEFAVGAPVTMDWPRALTVVVVPASTAEMLPVVAVGSDGATGTGDWLLATTTGSEFAIVCWPSEAGRTPDAPPPGKENGARLNRHSTWGVP